MSDAKTNTAEAQVWVPKGPVSLGDIYTQAWLEVKDQAPKTCIPAFTITADKATKRDDEPGRLYHVSITWESHDHITADDVVASYVAPETIPDPDDE